MKCPVCHVDRTEEEFKGFRVWFAPIGKRGPSVKGGKNEVIRVCPNCGIAFRPSPE